ncbi:MAG: DUF2269 domain-containing protein [Thermoanaerobaculia bacterium]
MILSPFARKSALIAHIVTSAGWIGAVVLYLALALTGLTSPIVRLVGAAYLAMDVAVRFVIIPLSFGSLLSGLVMSLGTAWGLFRHYWVIFKLILNVFAVTVLLMYTQSIVWAANLAMNQSLSQKDLALLKDPTHVIHTIGALVILLTATTLSVFKPRGVRPGGKGKTAERVIPSS